MSAAPTPTDVYADLADRLRRGQTVDQLVKVGQRTGWWTDADVDWVYDGHTGPRPADPDEPTAAPPVISLSSSSTVHTVQDPVTGETELIRQDVVDGVPAAPRPLAPAQQDVVDFVTTEAPQELAALAARTNHRPVPHPARSTQRPIPRPTPPTTRAPSDTVNPQVTPATTSAAGPYVTVLAADQLYVDHSYQRPLDKTRVTRMADGWDPRLLGLLDVSDRSPGTDPVNRYAIVNGQHRAAAGVRAGVTHFACNVHEGLDVAAEARLMHELDRTTKKLSGHEQWRARRGAGDQAVAEVERIAAVHGLTVAPQLADGVLRAYGAAEKLWAQGGEQLLNNTLAVLRGAYDRAAAAWQAPMVTGVGQLLLQYPEVDVDRLTRALTGASPTQLRANATAVREIDGGSLAQNMTRAITGLYNRTPGPGPRIAGGRA